MKRSEIKILLLRAPGTNCDAETIRALKDLGVLVELVHTQKIFREKNLMDYDALFFPGGFSYGDYVRSGAIWAKKCEYHLGRILENFINEERPVVGICNGFQLLVEAGFLPGFEGKSKHPEAALADNKWGYQCRWIRIKNVNKGNCLLTQEIPDDYIMRVPIAHGEGRVTFLKEDEEKILKKLCENDQLVFRYVKPNDSFADMERWHNPNGSLYDIAGICNPIGNVLGLMPHPERAYFWWQTPYWARNRPIYGDGRVFFESVINYIEKKF